MATQFNLSPHPKSLPRSDAREGNGQAMIPPMMAPSSSGPMLDRINTRIPTASTALMTAPTMGIAESSGPAKKMATAMMMQGAITATNARTHAAGSSSPDYASDQRTHKRQPE